MNQSHVNEPDREKLLGVNGNKASAHDTGHDDDHGHALSWRDINRVVFVAAAAGAMWFLGRSPNPYIIAIGVICTVVGGFPIFHEAYENITQRRMTMELSMAIAIVAALAIRELFTALVITLFVLVAEILEGLTVGRGRKAIQHLVDLLPSVATVRRSGSWTDVEIREVSTDDEVLVRPGGRIPVDGKVVGGHSFVDQAPITGESMPVEKHSGAIVYAGTINQSGALEVRVERLGRDTTFGKIIEAVETAEKSRAPIQGIADRLAGYLVYFALGAAVLTFLISPQHSFDHFGSHRGGSLWHRCGNPAGDPGVDWPGAQQGAIIKGGLYLEKLGEVDTVLLDKTGTLTYGTPELLDVRPASGTSAALLLRTAAIAESRSEHPIAKAILRKATQLGIPYEDPAIFEYTPGKGIIASSDGEEIIVGNQHFLLERGIRLNQDNGAMLGSEIFVARGGRFLGTLRNCRHASARSKECNSIPQIDAASNSAPDGRCKGRRGRRW